MPAARAGVDAACFRRQSGRFRALPRVGLRLAFRQFRPIIRGYYLGRIIEYETNFSRAGGLGRHRAMRSPGEGRRGLHLRLHQRRL